MSTIKYVLSESHNFILADYNPVNDLIKKKVQAWINVGLDVISQYLLDMSYSIALVGGGLCILLWLAGWKDGKRWTGILFMAEILIHYLLGTGVMVLK